MEFNLLKKCPMCDNDDVILFVEHIVSPYQNTLFLNYEDSIKVKRILVRMCYCKKCGFIFNDNFDENIELYNNLYNNCQEYSKYFIDYINSSIQYICDNYMHRNEKILDIGCGVSGKYLLDLVKKSNLYCEGTGYDPAYIGDKTIYVKCFEGDKTEERKINFITEYFNFYENSELPYSFIMSRHCIEHLINPIELLSLVKCSSENAIEFIETPDVTWILKNVRWFDFCHEHCSLFSPIALKIAAEKLGIYILENKCVYGDQYMQVFFKKNIENYESNIKANLNELKKLEELVLYYKSNEKSILEKFKSMILDGVTKKIAVWGAGAKGNTFVNILDSDKKYIDCIIDINNEKVGKYIPCTGHLVISPADIKKRKIEKILIMNENYEDEIKNTLCTLEMNEIELIVI